MPAAELHPSREDLEAFCQGTLADSLCCAVEAHLSECPVCQQQAAEPPGDNFVALLRSARGLDLTGCDTPALSADGVTTAPWASAAASAATAIPQEFAGHPRYRLIRLLGSGGMGAVWLAEHTVMRRTIALKLIRSEFLAKPGAAERFHREVQAAAQLHHPNIVTSHDADQAGQTHFLVMEYIEGESLADRVARSGPLPVADACRAVRDAALGLQHAHGHGLVHRDLKPHNLMLGADGDVKVLDFGLVFAGAGEPSGLTAENVVMGTPDYIAPEQAEDPHAADARSDIYSLGCTLYFLLTGRVPFPADSTLRKLDGHRKGKPEPVRKLRPEVPAELAGVLATMMAKAPDRRYQTAAAVAAALEPFTGELWRQGGRTPSKRGWFAAALLLLGMGLAGAAVYRVQTDRGELLITTESDDVKVVISEGGKVVRIIDVNTQKSIMLRAGEYELELIDGGEGLKLDIEKAVLTRGGKVVARIERVRQQPGSEEKAGEVRRFEGHTKQIIKVAVSRDGRLAASGSDDGTARLWDVATGKELHRLDHENRVYTVAFSPDGRRLLTGGDRARIRQWDTATGKELRGFEGHAHDVTDVAFSPNGRQVLSCDWVHTVRLWDAESGKVIYTLEGHTEAVMSVAFSPDGKRGISGSLDKTLRLWDLQTGKELRRFEGHTSPVRAVAFSPDGRRVLSGSWTGDGSVRLWDAETGRQLQVLKAIPKGTHGVAFSADGRRALVCGDGLYVQLWDLETGKLLHLLEGHSPVIGNAVFVAEGRFALSGGGDKMLRLWRLPVPAPASKP